MREFNRLALLAGFASLALIGAACGPSQPENRPDGGGTIDENCVDDSDCPDPDLFFCNTTTSTCQPSCRSKADCTAAVRGEFALEECEGNLGCQCDEGTCVAALCSADADCGGSKVCRSGACVDAPAAATAASCQVTPDFAVIKAGETATFWVSFWDAANAPVVLSGGIEWSAASDRVTGVTASGSSATVTGGTAGDAVDAVKVTAGGATCFAKVAVLDAAVPADQIRVTVVNELTGRPVTGGHILVSQASDGAEVDLQPMDEGGTTLLSLPAGGNQRVTVTAFHTDYTYVSVVDYDAASGSRDLQIALRRNQSDNYGGYKGTFTNVPTSPNIKAGIAGMSIPGAVTDLSITQLLGHTVPTDIQIGTAINEKDVPLPAGAFLAFTDPNPIKGEVSAQGVAGVCTSALSGITDVDAAIEQGLCGTRTAWALSGDVPLSDLPISAISGGLDNIDFGTLLSQIIPMFKRFNSSVIRDVQFRLKETPGAATGEHNFSDIAHFTGADHDFRQMPLGFSFAAKVPTLPKYKGSYADGLVILGGADVKGRGMVPLGLGAGVNTQEPKDGTLDPQADLPSPGMLLMRMAPTHHGLEGQQYALVAAALSLQSVNDSSAGLAMSALVHRFEENKLVFDPAGSTPVELTGAFLNYPENGKYNFTDAEQSGLPARTFRFVSGQDLSAASVIRVQFTDRADHRWQVVVDPAAAAAGFKLPAPPTAPVAYADRTFDSGASTGTRSTMLVQAIQLGSGGNAIGFRDLVELNGTNMDRLGDFMVAFSVIDFGRPEIEWVSPSNGATIAPGSTLRIDVSNFKVGNQAGDDGIVKVTFTGGTNCTELSITQDTSMGAGELSAQLPGSCTGQNVQMTATLYDVTGAQPIAPAVSRSITVNIQ